MEEPKSDTAQLLLAALETGWKKYRKELKRCRAEFSFDAVHDLRTSTRRILAIIQLLKSIFPRPRLKKLIRAFKAQLDIFDDPRDTQVTLAEISNVVQEFPQVEPFHEHLRQMEAKALRKARRKVKALETAKVKKRIRKTREALEAKKTEVHESDILDAVDNAFQRIEQRYSRVDLARPSTIHRVRIAFKSFRYMLEVVHPLVKGFPEENLKRMNDYQDLMGKIQDLEVLNQTMADYSESASLPELEPAHRYYEQQRAEAMSAYVEERDQLHSFWRAGPDQPFPWEKST